MVLPVPDLRIIAKEETWDLIMQYYNKFGKAAPPYNPESYGTAEAYVEKLKQWVQADKPVS